MSADDFFGGIIECYNAKTGKTDTFPICMSASKSGIPMKEIENIMLLLGGYMNTYIEWNIRKMQDELRMMEQRQLMTRESSYDDLMSDIINS